MTVLFADGELRFAWWNVQDFAHFDPERVIDRGWPKNKAQYEAKCRLLDTTFDDIFSNAIPDIIGLGETSLVAAEELRNRKFPNHSLHHDGSERKGDFQVAVLIRKGLGLESMTPIIGSNVPKSSRWMPIVQVNMSICQIRFIFCHWTSFGKNAQEYRGRLADAVRKSVYEYLYPPGRTRVPRHVVLVGDFNAEPFDPIFKDRLQAYRDRESAKRRPHYSDKDVSRVRLYNCGWRHLGETKPHGRVASGPHFAGTYLHADSEQWHTFDQILVSGGLLSQEPPFLDESQVEVIAPRELSGVGAKPGKFVYNTAEARGLSDHLPLVGCIRCR